MTSGRLARALSSKAFLIWLVGGWILYYVSFAVWSKEAFAGFVGGLGRNPLVIIPYVLFLISLVLNIKRAFRESLKKGVMFSVLRIPLWAGAVVFLTGFLLSAMFRTHLTELVGEGDVIDLPWSKTQLFVYGIEPGLREDTLEMETESSVFEYEPKVMLDDGKRQYEVGAFPPKRITGIYYHILDFGIGPGIRLSEGKETLVEGYMAVKLLPPGVVDGFDIPSYPYKISLRIAPDKVIQRGQSTAKLYNFGRLSYDVEVVKGEELIFSGNSKDGVFFDGLTLDFHRPFYWVNLEIARDPGILPVTTGIALISLGAPLWALSFAFRRKSAKRGESTTGFFA